MSYVNAWPSIVIDGLRAVARNGALVLLLFILPASASAATLQGKVIHITDGDIITVRVDRKDVKVRLAEIDAPELHQDYGQRAKQVLGNLIFGENVTIEAEGEDRYGRILGRIYKDGLDVNAEMVRMGYAWAYRKYAKDDSLYDLEKEAKTARRGLWASDVRIAPWNWRQERRERVPE